MNPLIWIYGGVHHDPGMRQRFLEELAKQQRAPHFVAVEWEKSVFEKLVLWRRWVEERLRSRWNFLTAQDCRELSLALAWEGDAHEECFPGTEVLSLETGFQEAQFKPDVLEGLARMLLRRLRDPADSLPDPVSKKELIDRMWRNAWQDKWSVEGAFERDARWEEAISKHISDLRDGWTAVVVGWQHADPEGDNQRLRGLLLSKGFTVKSVCLGP